MSGDNGKLKPDTPGGIESKEKDQGAKTPPDPNNPKTVNSVTIMEIRVHQLDNGKERTEIVAQEFMMVHHKRYMIDKLLEAMRITNHAVERKRLIKRATQAGFRKILGSAKGAFGKKRF